MGKRKEYYRVFCKSESSTHYAIAIVEAARLEELKHRCVKSVADFADLSSGTVTITVEVEPTTQLPEDGCDLTLYPVNPVEDVLVEEAAA